MTKQMAVKSISMVVVILDVVLCVYNQVVLDNPLDWC
jgi:hypothetical protein